MKKRIIAIILSVVLVLTAFAGCGLMVENPNRVANQTVVTVGQGEYQQVVTRREVVNAYNTYGYMYIYYYQMTPSDVLNMLVNSLTNDKIVAYAALNNLEKVSSSSSKDKNALYDPYLTTAEMNDIAIKVDEALSLAIDQLETEALRKTAGIEAPKYKVTPTGFTFKTSIPVDFAATTSRNSAIAQLTRNLSSNDLTIESFKVEQAVEFKRNAVVTKYKEKIKDEVNVVEEEVLIRYNTIVDKETESYAISAGAFAKKLEAISSNKSFSGDNFVLSVPQAGLGFVHSILLKFSDEQQKILDDLKKESENTELKDEEKTAKKAELEAKRKELLKEITATDNRIDWLKEYGTETTLFDTYAFDGEYTAKKVENVHVKDINGEYAYDNLTSKEYSITAFMTKIQNELSATRGNTIDGFQIYNSKAQNEKFLDLVWAYNDDPGMENNLVGYFSENTTFVEAYQNASKAVVKAGVGSYTLVESPDFGYFVVFCSNAFDKVGKTPYISSEKDVEGTFSNLFYNEVNKSLKENYLSEKVSALSASYVKDKKFIVIDEKEYKAIYDMINTK